MSANQMWPEAPVLPKASDEFRRDHYATRYGLSLTSKGLRALDRHLVILRASLNQGPTPRRVLKRYDWEAHDAGRKQKKRCKTFDAQLHDEAPEGYVMLADIARQIGVKKDTVAGHIRKYQFTPLEIKRGGKDTVYLTHEDAQEYKAWFHERYEVVG